MSTTIGPNIQDTNKLFRIAFAALKAIPNQELLVGVNKQAIENAFGLKSQGNDPFAVGDDFIKKIENFKPESTFDPARFLDPVAPTATIPAPAGNVSVSDRLKSIASLEQLKPLLSLDPLKLLFPSGNSPANQTGTAAAPATIIPAPLTGGEAATTPLDWLPGLWAGSSDLLKSVLSLDPFKTVFPSGKSLTSTTGTAAGGETVTMPWKFVPGLYVGSSDPFKTLFSLWDNSASVTNTAGATPVPAAAAPPLPTPVPAPSPPTPAPEPEPYIDQGGGGYDVGGSVGGDIGGISGI